MSILDLFQFLTTDILPIVLVLFGLGFVLGFCCFFYTLWRNKRNIKKIEKTIAKTGKQFEDNAAGFFYEILRQFDLVGNADALPIQSILIPDGAVLENGIKGTIEIDMAFATTKGIFVAECKHRHGYVTGTIAGETWSDDRSIFKNPLLQNENHIRFLRKNLLESIDFKAYADIPIYNTLVVNVPIIINKMGRKETLGSVDWDDENHLFVTISDETSLSKKALTNYMTLTKKALTDYMSFLEDRISIEDADIINRYLISYRGDETAMQEHLEYVKTLHPED